MLTPCIRPPLMNGCRKSRCRPKTRSTGTCGLGLLPGGRITPVMFGAGGADFSISTAAGSSNGVPTPWTFANGPTRPMTPLPSSMSPKAPEVHALYANGVRLIMRDTGWLGLGTCSVRFEGEEGWIETGDTGRIVVYPESLRSEVPVFTEAGTDPKRHIREFLNCVKTRSQPAANAAVACQSHIACHAAYIAWQLGRKLRFDPSKDEFIGDEEANRMRSAAIREPWHI